MKPADRQRRRTLIRLAPSLVVVVAALAAAAAEPEPTATPTPAPTPTVTRTPIVITDENLAEYAAQGRLTTSDGSSATAGSGERRPVHRTGTDAATRVEDAVADAASLAEDEKRQYWRRRYEQQLALVASIESQIAILDREIPGMWRDFYAWDDPAYRDGVIKVELDAALARSERLKQQLEVEREQIKKIKAEARKAGAEPGWFRGIAAPEPTPTPGN
ncbi:MAG TPA: hypothetical protein PKJ99_12130 [Thermoanaerobaculales bacterium]|nr:hypothetical protein [Thermoanaerobaculales bacterium]HPA81974.1 hypothetical protein [Thermoanaerobaculales bacterium]HQL31138.1 hypothetical protein [Thermoanaerobaculales bacterium]HQN97045.1 hypothetical protein [Thermoanaerobaculales bacterium]